MLHLCCIILIPRVRKNTCIRSREGGKKYRENVINPKNSGQNTRDRVKRREKGMDKCNVDRKKAFPSVERERRESNRYPKRIQVSTRTFVKHLFLR